MRVRPSSGLAGVEVNVAGFAAGIASRQPVLNSPANSGMVP